MRRLLLALVLAGCGNGGAVVSPDMSPANPCGQDVCIRTAPKNKVDMLFVLSDGPTMGTKLAAFRASLPALLDTLAQYPAAGAPADYHFGVVTADLGAGGSALPSFGCQPGGDGATLRASADMTGGVRYVEYDQLTGMQNVPDVAATLDAISDVGTSGCTFQQPLQAGYQALHDFVPENAGFLRSDAVLVVVYVSDADDCSAPYDTDLFDASSDGVARYGPLDRFRCTQFGVQCNGAPVPPMSVSGLTGCSSYDLSNGGKLTAVDRYINFFATPAAQGGVKLDPSDVVLAAIAAPADPVGVTITSPCADDASVAMCPTLNPSCIAVNDTSRFGDPAVRLQAVVGAARYHQAGSICNDSDDDVMKKLLPLGQGGVGPACLQTPVATRVDGTPDCVVENITTRPDGSQSIADVPSCAENGGVTPCWRLVDRLADYDTGGCTPPDVVPPMTCKLPPYCQPVIDPVDGMRQLYVPIVDWGGGAPDHATTSDFHCASPR